MPFPPTCQGQADICSCQSAASEERISSSFLEFAGPAADANSQRDLIASIVIQYLSEARAETLEDISFSTPLMEAGLDSLDMLKVDILFWGMRNRDWSCQSKPGYPALSAFLPR